MHCIHSSSNESLTCVLLGNIAKLVVVQEIMAREQELLLEEFTRFVGLLDGRGDLTVQHAKSWTMDELMESIHPVRPYS